MPSSNTVVLREMLKQRKAEVAPTMDDAEFFELFCPEQLLKSQDLSYDQIKDGMVGGGGDGGIDSVYAFVNGRLLTDDFDASPYKSDVMVDLVVITANTRTSYEEAVVDKLRIAVGDLLDLSRSLASVAKLYNASLLAAVGNFRNAYMALSGALPQLRVRFHYVTHGETAAVDAKVRDKSESLREDVGRLLPSPECVFAFVGANELLRLARTSPVGPVKLPLAANAIATDTGFVCLVKLSDYYGFITDGNGELKAAMLEANVRDYQGEVEVNKAIRETLGTPAAGKGEDFWSLNNGITILASQGAITGNVLTLKDPNIVNGLQTSVEIHKYFRQKPALLQDEPRSMLVRVTLTDDEAYRDRVIRATNTQTPIHPASLRATEHVHRNIEDYLKAHQLYYDRRKNYYKNQGKPQDSIVTISHLAQAVMALVLGEPDNSRARPSSLLKNPDDYARVFSESYPMGMYLTCARIMRRVESYLGSPQAAAPRDERTNLRFYLGMRVAHHLLGSQVVQPSDLDGLDLVAITDEALAPMLADLRHKLQEFSLLHSVPPDQAAKSPDFRQYVLADGGVAAQ